MKPLESEEEKAPAQFGVEKVPVALAVAFFFAIHYGLFHVVYALFLSVLGGSAAASIDMSAIWWMIIVFALSHAFSFFIHIRTEIKNANREMGKIFFQPYARIVPMHLTIIFGGLFLGVAAANAVGILLFLSIKTATDLAGHLFKHAANSSVSPNARLVEGMQ